MRNNNGVKIMVKTEWDEISYYESILKFPKTLAFCTVVYVKVKENFIKFLKNASSRGHTHERASARARTHARTHAHTHTHTRDTQLSIAISLDKAIM
jgi:hypothetical protein